MLILTFVGAPFIFRHQKDSGRWSIYNTEDLFDVTCILVSSAKIWDPIEVAEVKIEAPGGRRSGKGPDMKKMSRIF